VLKYDTVLKSNQGKWRYVSTFNTTSEIPNSLQNDQKPPQDIEKQILYLSLIEDITNFLLNYTYSVPCKKKKENMDSEKNLHITGNNFLLLTYFIKNAPVCNHSIRALASILLLTPRTITTTLQDLEELDLINRLYDKNSNYREGQTITIKPFLEKYILDRNITNLNSEDILTFLSTYSVEEIDTVSKINTVLDINTSTPVLYCFSFKNNKQNNTKNTNYENEKTNSNKFSFSSTKITELKEVFLACCFFGFENIELKLNYPKFNEFLQKLSEDENSFSQIVLYRQLYYAKQKMDSMPKVTTKWGYYFGVISIDQDKKSTDKNGKEIQEMTKFLISVAKELPLKINDLETQMIQNQILQTAYKTKGNVDPVKIIQKYLFPNLPTNILQISQALSELFKKAYSEYFEVVKKLEDKIQRKKWDIRNKN